MNIFLDIQSLRQTTYCHLSPLALQSWYANTPCKYALLIATYLARVLQTGRRFHPFSTPRKNYASLFLTVSVQGKRFSKKFGAFSIQSMYYFKLSYLIIFKIYYYGNKKSAIAR